MKKTLKKIVPTLVLSAVIILVGGFCDGLIASAQMGKNPVGIDQMMDNDATVVGMHQEGVPTKDSLKPCCVDRHNNTPTTEVGNFNVNVKIAAINSALAATNSNSFFRQKIGDSGDSSPPTPDILSSVLRRE